MAGSAPRLAVVYTDAAQRELIRVFAYTLETRGEMAAERYIAFLKSEIDGLAHTYSFGKPVEGHELLRYRIMKRRSRCDGHVAVYRIHQETVEVLRIFHTKQDWQGQL